MGKKIYVGNLPFSATNESLAEMFAPFGEVNSSKIIQDRETGRSKGFGFVEMTSGSAADSAIEKLHGSDFEGRSLTVNEARPSEKRDPSRMNGPKGPRIDFGRGYGQSERSNNRW
jgi:RNA recognition motif-containing protein